jgi:hypothetical protein
MRDLIRRIEAAEPATTPHAAAREAARRAAIRGAGAAPRSHDPRRLFRLTFAVTAAVAASVAALFLFGVIGGSGDSPSRIVLPGDDVSPAQQGPPAVAKPGIAATLVFRPLSGLSLDEAYTQMVRVIRARAATHRVAAVRVDRVDRDRALVTLTGTREPSVLRDVVAGSSVAAYDLDDVVEGGTLASFRNAVLRAIELAPGAPAQVFYLFRDGRLVRGPAPTADALRGLSKALPAGSQILGMPEGYAILRRQWAPDATGVPQRLGSTQFFVVRDRPAVTPQEVVDAPWPVAPAAGGQSATTELELTTDGRRAWDGLLARVADRAASTDRPQRVAVAVNGDIQQMITADATGRLDTRPGSPVLEVGAGIGDSTGFRLVTPVATSIARDGSIPATVWIADTYRVGPSPVMLGEKVTPLPAGVRRVLAFDRTEPADRSTVRRALVARGPDGEWSVWNYLLQTGTPRGVVLGPRRDDGFGFGCTRTQRIDDCGGSAIFHLFAVPAATRTLRFTSSSGSVREAAAGNGWALALGARRTGPGGPPASPSVAEALDAGGRVIARRSAPWPLP